MVLQKCRDGLFADMTLSRAEMPFSIASIVDETVKFRTHRKINKKQINLISDTLRSSNAQWFCEKWVEFVWSDGSALAAK